MLLLVRLTKQAVEECRIKNSNGTQFMFLLQVVTL